MRPKTYARRKEAAPKEARRGQILVLMALLSTTFIIMFGMVVSVGHLVQAKMNLQNAVDLAAMSGASWQARYLNFLALVNYRMRQNYKFTLYDLYVTQSRFNKGFQNEVNGGFGQFDRIDGDKVVFGICQQSFGYCARINVPGLNGQQIVETGGCTDKSTDLCRNVFGQGSQGQTIPPIVPSPVVNLNPALFAANEAIRALAQQAKEICNGARDQNQKYFKYIMTKLDRRQRFQAAQFLRILSAWRNDFSNSDDGKLAEPGDPTPIFRADKTIVRTFQSNLIDANLNGNAQIFYVNPAMTRAPQVKEFTGGADQFINELTARSGSPLDPYFERISVNFKVYAVEFTDAGGGCESRIRLQRYPSNEEGAPNRVGVLLGISRIRNQGDQLVQSGPPKVPFDVVLRAVATPRLLFWPRGLTPTISAVGAAKAFGSRIAPRGDVVNIEISGLPDNDPTALANMSFFPGDIETNRPNGVPASLPGLGHKIVLNYLVSHLPVRSGSVFTSGENVDRPSPVNSSAQFCDKDVSFLCLALAPTLYEGLFWNAFPNPQNVTFAKIFTPVAPEALLSSLPSIAEVPGLLTTDPGIYALEDRQTSADAGQNPDDWHSTALLGGPDANRFRFQSRPAFFADQKSVMSSFSPALDIDSFDSGGTVGSADSGRMGYQIKLASVRQICEDVDHGGGVNGGQLGAGGGPGAQGLKAYCDESEPRVNY